MKTSKKILAVDDNKDNLFVLTAVLEDVLPQARVLTAVSGTDGFAIAREERPDLILLDVLMPGIDGYQLCQLLKTHEGKRGRCVSMFEIFFYSTLLLFPGKNGTGKLCMPKIFLPGTKSP